MRRRLIVAVLGVTCAGCSASGSSAADRTFVSEVHAAAPEIGTYRNDTQLVRLGHAACDGFAAGASYQELADRLALLEGQSVLPSTDLGAVISAAADNFCPKYRSDVG